MQRYRARENLDEYEDELEDRYEDEDEDEYEDEEGDEEEKEEEEEKPRSEEEIRYLELREKLKAKHRSNLRRENGKNGVNVDPKKLIKFDFFGPSTPVIAQRVIEQRKSLAETRHLAPKSSTSQNDVKKASMSSTTVSNNRPSGDKPRPMQVKSKAQVLKQTRDYSWLMSEGAEIPKPTNDPGPRKSLPSKPAPENGRSSQVQAKRVDSSSHSAKKGYDSREQRKPPTNSQSRDDRRVPSQRPASSDSRRQLELRKQSLPHKQTGSSIGSGSRSNVQKVFPPKKPLPSSDRKMAVSSVERKPSSVRPPPVVTKTSTVGQQRPPPTVKSQPSSVNNNRVENHRRDVQRSSDNKIVRRESANPPKSQTVKQSNQSSRQSNMENRHIVKKQKPSEPLQRSSGGLSRERDHKIKKRKSPDSDPELDFRSCIRSMFGYNPNRYVDEDDDDDCMEATFEDIDREERRSAKIAKKEDDEEFIKIQEEERREREAALRRKAKKAKTNHR